MAPRPECFQWRARCGPSLRAANLVQPEHWIASNSPLIRETWRRETGAFFSALEFPAFLAKMQDLRVNPDNLRVVLLSGLGREKLALSEAD